MKCPNCELENPSGALPCDCGYTFSNTGGEAWMSRGRGENRVVCSRPPKDEELKTVIDKLGAEGWEMVSARRASDGDTRDPKMSYEMIFKKRGAAAEAIPAIPRQPEQNR